ncbi:TPA: hypothetical protein QCR38_005004 [Bacillus cereus]|nr:hypothetical protein [Bacillus cereus]
MLIMSVFLFLMRRRKKKLESN